MRVTKARTHIDANTHTHMFLSKWTFPTISDLRILKVGPLTRNQSNYCRWKHTIICKQSMPKSPRFLRCLTVVSFAFLKQLAVKLPTFLLAILLHLVGQTLGRTCVKWPQIVKGRWGWPAAGRRLLVPCQFESHTIYDLLNVVK